VFWNILRFFFSKHCRNVDKNALDFFLQNLIVLRRLASVHVFFNWCLHIFADLATHPQSTNAQPSNLLIILQTLSRFTIKGKLLNIHQTLYDLLLLLLSLYPNCFCTLDKDIGQTITVWCIFKAGKREKNSNDVFLKRVKRVNDSLFYKEWGVCLKHLKTWKAGLFYVVNCSPSDNLLSFLIHSKHLLTEENWK